MTVHQPGQRCSDEQLLRAGVRPEVDARRVGRVVQHHHQHCGCNGHQSDDRQHDPDSPPTSQRAQGDHHDRPQEIPLLFDGQRPRVAQRARSEQRIEVALIGDDEAPVGDVAQCRHRIGTYGSPLLRQPPEPTGGDGRRDHRNERWHEPAETSDPERLEIDAIGVRRLPHQERRDQESRDDEEEVDAEEAPSCERAVQVIRNDHRNRHGAQPVECG